MKSGGTRDIGEKQLQKIQEKQTQEREKHN
jgi:hypothetical protein